MASTRPMAPPTPARFEPASLVASPSVAGGSRKGTPGAGDEEDEKDKIDGKEQDNSAEDEEEDEARASDVSRQLCTA